jgi:hypothetical protein
VIGLAKPREFHWDRFWSLWSDWKLTMKKIMIEISEDDAKHVGRLIDQLSDDRPNSHGKLTFKTLAQMLMQDVALAVRQPGSREGANMAQVLAGHGYRV